MVCGVRATRESDTIRYVLSGQIARGICAVLVPGQASTRRRYSRVWACETERSVAQQCIADAHHATGRARHGSVWSRQHSRAVQHKIGHAHRHPYSPDDATYVARVLIRPPHRTSSLDTHTLVVSGMARTITLRYYSEESGCATPHSCVGLLKGSASGRKRPPQREAKS